MATRVGLFVDTDTDDDDASDGDTPLGVTTTAARRRKPALDDDDDRMDDDGDNILRAPFAHKVNLTDATDALRAHETALEALTSAYRDYARADGGEDVATGAGDADDGDELVGGLNVVSADDDASERALGARRAHATYSAALDAAKRALSASHASVTSHAAPREAKDASRGTDAYAQRGASRGCAFGARGDIAVPVMRDGTTTTTISVRAVRTSQAMEACVGALEVALAQAVPRAGGGVRHACARESSSDAPYGVAAVCLRHLEAVVEVLTSSVSDGGEGSEELLRARVEAEVSAWALTSELFAEDKLGAARGTAADVHRRRAGVSAWLREQVSRKAPAEEELVGRKAASTHVAGGRTVSAARAAAAHGDPRLATCIAQIGSGKNVSFYAKQQLNRWRAGPVGKYVSSESEEAFKLLAGEVARDDDGMGWYQNFGLHLWLGTGPTSPLREVVKSYCDAVKLRKAANPSPPCATDATLEANKATHLRDVAFNILDLAASAEDGVVPSTAEIRLAFHPLTYSDDVLNASLAWHLFMMLNAIDVVRGEDVDALADEITVAFVSQLMSMTDRTHCHWIVFVAQHLRDQTRREKMTSHILRERFEEWNGDDAKMAFLLNQCAVPQSALAEAKTLWFTYSNPQA